MMKFLKSVFFTIVCILSFFLCSNNLFAESSFNIEEKDISTKEFFLKGNWDFYWNKLISNNSDLKNNKPDEVVAVPSRWTNEKKYNANGCATYRTVINVPYDGIYTFIVPFLERSYNIYANDSLVASDGNVSCNKNEYKPGRTTKVISVLSKDKKIELNVQIASFDDIYAGMQNTISIGKPDIINRSMEKSIAFNVSILAAILIMALYHLIMFLTRKKDLSFLVFFFFSLAIVTRLVFSDFMAKWLFPGIDYDLIMRLAFVSMILTPMLLVMFTRYLFYSEKSKSNMLKISVIYSIPIVLFIMLFPVHIFSKFLHIYQVGVIVIPLFAFYHLIRAIVYKKDGALVLLFGTIILFLFAINDILYTNGTIHTGLFIPFGLIIFIFCQSFVLAKKYNKISELYIKDPLTSTYNKRYLLDYLEDNIVTCKKDINKNFSIAIIDIDYFKKVNDTYGHDFGDYVLKCVSENIIESIRGYDVFARYGGEEFVIIFNNLNSKESFNICDRIREKLSNLEMIGLDKSNNKINAKITISIGLSNYIRNRHMNYNQLIKSADDCLYRAKNSGRNRVVANFDN